MKKTFFSLLIFGMFWTGLRAQTPPDDSGVWIIAGGGEKPSRVVLLADENSIKSVQVGSRTAIDIAIRQIAEDPNYSGLHSGTARVFCDKGTIVGINIMMVNKGKVSKIPDDPESEAKSDGENQILKFVCNQGKDERQRIFPPTVEMAKSISNTGFLFIGEKETKMDAEFFVRHALWEPDRWIENLKNEAKGREQIYNVFKSQLDHLEAVAVMAKDMKAQMEDEALRAKERRAGPKVRRINNLIGLTEADVVKALGKPYDSKDDGKGNR